MYYVNTGHFLNYFGSYAEEKGYYPSAKGYSIVKLYTSNSNKKKIEANFTGII